MADVRGVIDWLVRGVPGAKTALEVVAKMCPDLVAAGLPLDRCEAMVRTLHPQIAGRHFHWQPDRTATVTDRSFEELHSPEMASFAVMSVFATHGATRRRLVPAPREPDLAGLAAEGYTDWFAGPLAFITGEIHAITFATKRPGGFTDRDLEDLASVLPPLSRIAETLALLRTATNLLNTYVGHDAGARILAGQIQRGHVSGIHAVIWFSDLRGFTAMSSSRSPSEIVATLNDVFDCQVPAIEAHGGEVLKYMGDGMFAIFPCDHHDRGQRCDDALLAAIESQKALAELNARRTAAGKDAVRFGVALHVGDVSYGNIGGANRLDFTCIGAAVNLAARLQGITGQLGRDIVVSAEVAGACSARLEDLGAFALKGVTDAAKAFGLPKR